ncbi:MAG: N-acetylglucosamine-6-phosphate deacetylase [Lachnospiraceae bacterium]|nr:N-acetylglucosamine-6-phosphate deacetylase [Lachnospiraceae bacterium]
MRTIIYNANVYGENGTFSPGCVQIENGRITEVSDETPRVDGEFIDARGGFLIPGLTDIHFHGCNSYDFCDGTTEAVHGMAGYEASVGVTQICPATMTIAEDSLLQIAQTAAAFVKEADPAGCCEAELVGINMEGPFISKAKKGAQNEAFIRPADMDLFSRLQEASGNLFKIVDLAVEEPGAMEFIRESKQRYGEDVVLSIAHTTADYDTAKASIEAGVSHITHLYNAMPPFTHRAPGVVGAACEASQVHPEMICDGIHIHPAVMQATFKMFGKERMIIISDSMRATGLPDGESELGGQKVIKKGAYATLEDGTLAGSVTNLMDCVRVLVKKQVLSLEDAIYCSAVTPAKEIGIFDRFGSITPGKVANLVLLNKDLSLDFTMIRGKLIGDTSR